jgi:hypothetical protein
MKSPRQSQKIYNTPTLQMNESTEQNKLTFPLLAVCLLQVM